MITARPRPGRQLGLTSAELASPLGRFWRPELPPLAPGIVEALAGPAAPPLFPRLDDIAGWLESQAPRQQCGFTAAGGGVQVMLRTAMPGVTPAMVDWWFAWHSDSPERYKLWHPQAHVHAEWARRPADPASCVGGVSCVDEYLGHELGRFEIEFVAPASLGFTPAQLERAAVVAARVGLPRLPVSGGALLHHVRDGVMRSFFWVGGPWASGQGVLRRALVPLAARAVQPTLADARALLLHCAQEMSHLATFLPALSAEVTGSTSRPSRTR